MKNLHKDMQPLEFGRVILCGCSGKWYEALEGRELLAYLEFSYINGKKILFDARPLFLPEPLKKYSGLSIHPKDLILT